MDGYEKTPTLRLNKPKRGDFNWDLPLNENWDILDRVGGAQLPLLATIELDYRLSGDAAIGWALAGSTLSGNTYTSLWTAMKKAYDRSTAADEEHYGKTYSVRTDAVTGWRFVTADVYDLAYSAIGESLGHVLDTSAKTIRLNKSWASYILPDIGNVGRVLDETLPNVKGSLSSVGNTRGYGNTTTEAFIKLLTIEDSMVAAGDVLKVKKVIYVLVLIEVIAVLLVFLLIEIMPGFAHKVRISCATTR